jgi:hypothetical protein
VEAVKTSHEDHIKQATAPSKVQIHQTAVGKCDAQLIFGLLPHLHPSATFALGHHRHCACHGAPGRTHGVPDTLDGNRLVTVTIVEQDVYSFALQIHGLHLPGVHAWIPGARCQHRVADLQQRASSGERGHPEAVCGRALASRPRLHPSVSPDVSLETKSKGVGALFL